MNNSWSEDEQIDAIPEEDENDEEEIDEDDGANEILNQKISGDQVDDDGEEAEGADDEDEDEFKVGDKFRVIDDFEADLEDDLTIKKGEIIEFIEYWYVIDLE